MMKFLWFGKADTPDTPELKETRDQQFDRELAEARECVPEFIANMKEGCAAQWQIVQDEHANDIATYSISATRHGDFLMVAMTRSIKVGWIEKSAIAINLAKTEHIMTTSGRAPDQEGTVSLYHDVYSSPSGVTANGESIVTLPRDIFTAPYRGSTGSEDDSGHGYGHGYEKSLNARIDELPRFATSDVIHFVGTDLSLSVPFGLGNETMEIVLKAISDGYEAPVKSVLSA